MNTFVSLPAKKIIDYIENSRTAIYFVAASLSSDIARKLVEFKNKSSDRKVVVAVDLSYKVCHQGFGQIEIFDILKLAKIEPYKIKNLRLGILVFDNTAFLFNKTSLMLEDDNDNDALNAIEIELDYALKILKNYIPDEAEAFEKISKITQDEILNVKVTLQEYPPPKFNELRKINVFQSAIQYVHLAFEGGGIESKTIKIPSVLMRLPELKEPDNKFKTTYKLISENSEIIPEKINKKLEQIRKDYLISLDKKYGSIIFLKKVEEFKKEISELKEEVESAKPNLVKEVQNQIDLRIKDIVKTILPMLRNNPPEELLNYSNGNVKDEILVRYITDCLNKAVPKAEKLVSEMKIECVFKGVTYDTTKESEFINLLKEKLRYYDIGLFNEFDALIYGDINTTRLF